MVPLQPHGEIRSFFLEKKNDEEELGLSVPWQMRQVAFFSLPLALYLSESLVVILTVTPLQILESINLAHVIGSISKPR